MTKKPIDNASGEPVLLGWKELLDLPQWGIRNLVAKIDTGAKTSALDVKELVHLDDGRVRFEVVLSRRDRSQTQVVETPVDSIKRVRSSNGQVQERIQVSTVIAIGGLRKTVILNLVCRKQMICRALLGRTALSQTFLVDPSRKYLNGKRKKARTVSMPGSH